MKKKKHLTIKNYKSIKTSELTEIQKGILR